MKNLIVVWLLASVLFFSCEKNPADGVWFNGKTDERIWLEINHHQYTLINEKFSEQETLIHKKGIIIYRNDSIQFIPAKIFDFGEQKWLLDYDKYRPVYHVQVSGDSLKLSNYTGLVVYFRQSGQ